jgi:uncharacterized protein
MLVNSMPQITVIKQDLEGCETWRYTGKTLERGENFIILEAEFNRADTPFHDIILKQGDRFVERFYTDRWYNIFEIHDREDDQLKGWYSNIGYPAIIEDEQVSYIDLALDLLVYPDGRQQVLDEDEFEEMPLTAEARRKARAALEELQELFKHKLEGQAEI